ncbi:hypothetical protein GCM10007989_07370 [Devosia pacifica]|uniref:Uncharacterized protein n=1 Tax=Devosia pacifica TaxID=1335967 RepID=A0A918VNF8_9HYPH|nr:hypothetical protein [Devosia pacifica]GHA15141.1 hypothetical protein GCM10007989_07370 [Devosia pacifica]
MTYLTIMQSVARNAGIEPPTAISGNDPDQVLLGQFINEAGQEITRRVDWGVLRKTHTLTGTGAALDHPLPADFDRFPMGLSITAGTDRVRGSLTSDEWASLTPIAGTPRYFYLYGTKVAFYPFLKSGDTAKLIYQSKNWALAGSTPGSRLVAQTDTTVLSETLIESGAVWRWRRHVGKSFSDHLAEFEGQLADYAKFDGGVRLP